MQEVKTTNYYMLVKKGLTQRLPVAINGKSFLMWPLAKSHADAVRLAHYVQKPGMPPIRPALIGSIEGETLEAHIRLAIEDRCDGTCCVDSWAEDGSPRWKIRMFD